MHVAAEALFTDFLLRKRLVESKRRRAALHLMRTRVFEGKLYVVLLVEEVILHVKQCLRRGRVAHRKRGDLLWQ